MSAESITDFLIAAQLSSFVPLKSTTLYVILSVTSLSKFESAPKADVEPTSSWSKSMTI
jgi:hypothetical protein